MLYWRNANQGMDFTTKDDAASFIAEAAFDDDAPRFLPIAGDTASARDLAEIMSTLSGTHVKPTYVGSIGMLRLMARIGKAMSKTKDERYPTWQGTQYFGNM